MTLTLSPGTVIAGRYRVQRELGRGGMGAVYVVEHVHTGDLLALKVLLAGLAANAQAVERFKREARASAKIKSEHVVRVTDADVAAELDGAPFLVMELLDGHDLEREVETNGALAPKLVVSALAQAARALDRAHGLGVVHRDLKPENLFLHRREDGTTITKILDFGISKMIAAGEIAAASMTSTGAIMGTPLYMSPEQARGQMELIDGRSDQWALALVALRLLTGDVYWRAPHLAGLMVAIVVERMLPPSERWPGTVVATEAVDAWFARACDRNPSNRFATVSEMVRELGLALGITAETTTDALSTLARAEASTGVPDHTGASFQSSGVGRTTGFGVLTNSLVVPAAPRSRRRVLVGVGVTLALAGIAAFGLFLARPHTQTATVDSSILASGAEPPSADNPSPRASTASSASVAPALAPPPTASVASSTTKVSSAKVHTAPKPRESATAKRYDPAAP